MKKINSKQENINLVIKTIYADKVISKKEVSEKTGLSPASLTIICRSLLEERLIRERGEVLENKAGRRRQLLEINPKYKYSLGVDIQPDLTTYSVSDFSGTIIWRNILPSPGKKDPLDFLNEISNELNKVIHQTQKNSKEILGIGISVIGRVDSQSGKTLTPIGFWDDEVGVADYIGRKTSLPVTLYNNIQAMTIYEAFLNSSLKDFFLVKYDRGIGGAALIDGHLSKNNDLEFGHSILEYDSDEYCPMCKRRGCLENTISGPAIEKIIIEEFNKEMFPQLYLLVDGNSSRITLDKIIESAESGGIRECLILKRSAKLMAVSLLNIYSFLPIDRIILNGKPFNSKLYTDYLNSYLREYQLTEFSHRLSLSAVTQELQGAAPAIAVLSDFFNR